MSTRALSLQKGHEPKLHLGLRLRVFNAAIEKKRRDLGMTMKDLAERTRIHVVTLYAIKGLRYRPTLKQAVRLAEVLDLSLDDIWPGWLEPLPTSEAVTTREVDQPSFEPLSRAFGLPEYRIEYLPEASAERADAAHQLRSVLETLTPRQQKALILRFGLDDGRPRSLKEVGLELGVKVERIRQIEAAALRRLRHATRRKRLEDFIR